MRKSQKERKQNSLKEIEDELEIEREIAIKRE